MMSNGSRWGVKGSSEVSEGLTAVYRYEENLNLANATLGAGNRLSSVGLSGGFGTVTLGQIWSASYNHVGVLTDNGVWSGNNNSPTLRTSSNLSYSASTGPISFQLDAGMGAGTGRSLDMAQLGMSFDTGAATIGMAFTANKSDTQVVRTSALGVSVPVGGLTLASSWMEAKTTTFETDGSSGSLGSPALCEKKRFANALVNLKEGNYAVMINDDGEVVQKSTTTPLKLVPGATTYIPANVDDKSGEYECDSPQARPNNKPITDVDGGPYNDVAIVSKFQDAVASTAAVVPTEEKTDKAKQMRFSVTGPLGDTGMSFAVNVHNNPDKKGVGENPWNAHVSKSLGGGARLAFEYIDNDDNVNSETGKKIANETLVHLQVDF